MMTMEAGNLILQQDLFETDSAKTSIASRNLRVRHRLQGSGRSFQVGVDRVLDEDYAAHVMTDLGRRSQEELMCLVLDHSDRILALISHSKGNYSGAQFDLKLVASAVASVTNASSFWLAHQHPSGNTAPSPEDEQATRAVAEAIAPLGIDFRGQVVVGPDPTQAHFIHPKWILSRRTTPVQFDRIHELPVQELFISHYEPPFDPPINRTSDVAQHISNQNLSSGLLLLSQKHDVLGSVEIGSDEISALRANKRGEAILSALLESGASRVVVVADDKEKAHNLCGFVNSFDHLDSENGLLMDAFVRSPEGSDEFKSLLSEGDFINPAGVWFSRQPNRVDSTLETASDAARDDFVTVMHDPAMAAFQAAYDEANGEGAFASHSDSDIGAELFDLADPLVLRSGQLNPKDIAMGNRSTSLAAVSKYTAMFQKDSVPPPLWVRWTGSEWSLLEGGNRLQSALDAQVEAVPVIDATPLLSLDWEGYFSGLALNQLGLSAENSEQPGVRFSFGGELSKTANLAGLENAKALARNELPAEAIRQGTGWHQGPDSVWRYEIDDSKAALQPLNETTSSNIDHYADWAHEAEIRERGVPLPQALDHRALFEAYPTLKSVRLKVDDSLPHSGEWDSDQRTLTIKDPFSYRQPEGLSTPRALGILIHELQHVIQGIEGFAKGGNPAQFDDLVSRAYATEIGQIEHALAVADSFSLSPAKLSKTMEGVLTPAVVSLLHDMPANHLQSLVRHYQMGDLSPRALYLELFGEVEARNTERRLSMAPEQRRDVPPEATQDVPDAAVVVWGAKELQVVKGEPTRALVESSELNRTDLPMDHESRMARAEQMGFDTTRVLYHGTGSDVSEFNSMAWGSFDPDLANVYADFRAKISGSTPNVMPVYQRAKRLFEADELPKNTSVGAVLGEAYRQALTAGQVVDRQDILARMAELRQLCARTGEAPYKPHELWFRESYAFENDAGPGLLIDALEQMGFDGIRYTENKHRTQGVFRAYNVRSIYAAFDPASSRESGVAFSRSTEGSADPNKSISEPEWTRSPKRLLQHDTGTAPAGDFLRWDAPWQDQSASTVAALHSLGVTLPDDAPGSEAYAKLQATLRSEGLVNEALLACGVIGIAFNAGQPGEGLTYSSFLGITGNQAKSEANSGRALFSFAGPGAATACQHSLTEAKWQASNGTNREDVRQDTGWFQGADDQWRFEIDDSKASLDQGAWYADGEVGGEPMMKMQGSLGTQVVVASPAVAERLGTRSLVQPGLLHHDRLFAAYPDLAGVQAEIKLSAGYPFAARGHYRDFDRTIYLEVNPHLGGDPLTSLMHEVQHSIQFRENFALGGSPSDMHYVDALHERLVGYEQASDSHVATDLYRRLAGEVEARNVEARLQYDAQHRDVTSPEHTQDIAAEDVIVYWNRSDSPAFAPATTALESRASMANGFQAWFRNSVTVNEDGSPRVFYHGTRGDFTVFDPTSVRSRFDFSLGFHLTSATDEASVYADSIANLSAGFNPKSANSKPPAPGGNIMPMYVRAENPLVIETSHVAASMEADIERDAIAETLAAAHDAGNPYDSVIIHSGSGTDFAHTNVIVFDPSQLKSAIGNLGTYRSDNPDVRFSRGPVVDPYTLPVADALLAAEVVAEQVNVAYGAGQWDLAEDLDAELDGLYQRLEHGLSATEEDGLAMERLIHGKVQSTQLAAGPGSYDDAEVGLSEVLAKNYQDFFIDDIGYMEDASKLANLRDCIENFHGSTKQITDAEVFSAAQDAYDNRISLRSRTKTSIGLDVGEFLASNPPVARFSRAPIQESASFQNWFKDSTVKDSAGAPLVVYHGSPDVRNIYDEGFRGVPGGAFFATSRKAVADTYADDRRAMDYQNAEPHVIPLYLSIQNPLVIEGAGRHWRETAKHIDEAKEHGHDGVIIRHSRDEHGKTAIENSMVSDIYVFFSPNQAKSALTDQQMSRVDGRPIPNALPNVGHFDPGTKNIRFSFGTARATTADHYLLSHAQQRLKAGESAEAIRQDTGWFQGAEGHWRFEISDHQSAVAASFAATNRDFGDAFRAETSNDRPNLSVSDVLDHPRLFAAYPELAFISVQPTSSQASSFVRGTDSEPPAVLINESTPMSALRSVLLHELQHVIQHSDNLAQGGPSGTGMWLGNFRPLALAEYRDLQDATQRPLSKADYAQKAWGSEQITKAIHRDYIDNYIPSFHGARTKINDSDLQATAAHKAYRRLAGEVEARNVQVRRDMTEADRIATAPALTADTPQDQLSIVLNGTPIASQTISEQLQESLGGAKNRPVFSRSPALSPSFSKWFGRSVLVDADSNPLTAYHGTTAALFQSFKPSDDGTMGAGIYFHTSPREASFWGGHRSPDDIEDELGGRVIPVHLRIEKPMYGEQYDRLADAIGDHAANHWARQHGHDGIISQGGEIVVFSADQIMSTMDGQASARPEVLFMRGAPVPGFQDSPGTEAYTEAESVKALDMSTEARLERAKAQGYDTSTVYYCGTSSSFDAFKKEMIGTQTATPLTFPQGFYFTNEPTLAANYGKGPGQNIMPVFLKPGRIANTDNGILEAASALAAGEADSVYTRRVAVIREPERIRSIFAAFDPEHEHESNILFSRSPAQGQTAYHGTSQRFESFSTEALGSGEGNHSYGYGLYFAGSRADAVEYSKGFPAAASAALREAIEAATGDDMTPALKGNIQAKIDLHHADLAELAGSLDVHSEMVTYDDRESRAAGVAARVVRQYAATHGPSLAPQGRYVYEVGLPHDQDLLDWHKPLSEQPMAVQNMFRNGYGELTLPANTAGRQLYSKVAAGLNKQDGARYFREMGVKGVRYLDLAPRSDAPDGEPVVNFVVFDAADVAIRHVEEITNEGTPRFSRSAGIASESDLSPLLAALNTVELQNLVDEHGGDHSLHVDNATRDELIHVALAAGADQVINDQLNEHIAYAILQAGDLSDPIAARVSETAIAEAIRDGATGYDELAVKRIRVAARTSTRQMDQSGTPINSPFAATDTSPEAQQYRLGCQELAYQYCRLDSIDHVLGGPPADRQATLASIQHYEWANKLLAEGMPLSALKAIYDQMEKTKSPPAPGALARDRSAIHLGRPAAGQEQRSVFSDQCELTYKVAADGTVTVSEVSVPPLGNLDQAAPLIRQFLASCVEVNRPVHLAASGDPLAVARQRAFYESLGMHPVVETGKPWSGTLAYNTAENPVVRFRRDEQAGTDSHLMVSGQKRGLLNADGRPLSEQLRTTEKFWQWFGNSAAVDATGRPKVMFRGEHGSSQQPVIESASGIPFQFREAGLSFGGIATANEYAQSPNDRRETPAAPRVMPVYARIENPIVNTPDDPFIDFPVLIDALGADRATQIALKFNKYIFNTNNWDELSAESGIDNLPEFLAAGDSWLEKLYVDAYPVLADHEIAGWLRDAGYDGAIHAGNGVSFDDIEYKVFDPSQVISAVGDIETQLDLALAHRSMGKAKHALPDHVIIKGKSLPTKTCDGRDIAQNEAAVRNFWQWQLAGTTQDLLAGVTDAHDRPTLFYHASGADIDAFRMGGTGKTFGTGAFLTSNVNVANTYAGTRQAPAVYPTFVQLKRGVIVEADGAAWNRLDSEVAIQYPDGTDDELGQIFDMGPYADEYASTDDLARWAKDQGFDSVLFRNVLDRGPHSTADFREAGDTVVVFDPTQIKSALGNDGNFNPRSPGIRFSRRVWHGTDQDLTRFDSRHVGTGTGHSVIAHGLYFSSSRETAEYYQRMLAARKVIGVDGAQFGLSQDVAEEVAETLLQVRAESNYEFQECLHAADPSMAKERAIAQAIADGVITPSPGYLYQVALAPAAEDFLDWDLSLSDQSAKVRPLLADIPMDQVPTPEFNSWLESEFPSFAGEGWHSLSDTQRLGISEIYSDETGELAQCSYRKTGEGLYRALTDQLGSMQAASELLRQKGIPGIRYDSPAYTIDSGAPAEDFVVFDDSMVKVEARFSRSPKPGQPEPALAEARVVQSPEADLSRVYYHGTGAEIDIFRRKDLNGKDTSHFLDVGIHFSANPDLANTYAAYSRFPGKAKGLSRDLQAGNPVVYPAFLVKGHCLDLREGCPADFLGPLKAMAQDVGISPRSKYMALATVDPLGLLARIQQVGGRQNLQSFLTSMGYDSVDYRMGGDDCRMVFDPLQIRPLFAGPDGHLTKEHQVLFSRSTSTHYHGSGRDLDRFQGNYFWASESSELASDYAELHSMSGSATTARIYPVKLYVDSAFDADELPAALTVGQFMLGLVEQAQRDGRPISLEHAKAVGDQLLTKSRLEEAGPHFSPHDFWYRPDMFGEGGLLVIKQLLENAGYDGLTYTEQGQRTIGAFRPSQVESSLTGERLMKELGSPGVRFSRAFHGSEATFDQFSSDYGLTGEGSQGFGAGLYFTSEQSVGDSYRRDLAQVSWRIDDRLCRKSEFDDTIRALFGSDAVETAALIAMMLQDGSPREEIRQRLKVVSADSAEHLAALSILDQIEYNPCGSEAPFIHVNFGGVAYDDMAPDEQHMASTLRTSLRSANEIFPRSTTEQLINRVQENAVVDIRQCQTEQDEIRRAMPDLADQPDALAKAQRRLARLQRDIDTAEPLVAALKRQDLAVIDGRGQYRRHGHIYEVDLKPEPEQYLLWDAPFAEQSRYVQDALRNLESLPEGVRAIFGAEHMNCSHIYHELAHSLGGSVQASEALLEAGIRGNKYLDGLRRGVTKESASFNYVLYSPQDVVVAARFSRARPAIANGPLYHAAPVDGIPEHHIVTTDLENGRVFSPHEMPGTHGFESHRGTVGARVLASEPLVVSEQYQSIPDNEFLAAAEALQIPEAEAQALYERFDAAATGREQHQVLMDSTPEAFWRHLAKELDFDSVRFDGVGPASPGEQVIVVTGTHLLRSPYVERLSIANLDPAPAPQHPTAPARWMSEDYDYQSVAELLQGLDDGSLLVHVRVKNDYDPNETLSPTAGPFLRSTESWQYSADIAAEEGQDGPQLVFLADSLGWALTGRRNVLASVRGSSDDELEVVFVPKRGNTSVAQYVGSDHDQVRLSDGSFVQYRESEIYDEYDPNYREVPGGVESGDWFSREPQDVVARLDLSDLAPPSAPRFSRMIEPSPNRWYRSNLEGAIAEQPTSGYPAAQWAALVTGLSRKGVRQEEIEQSGVLEWLFQQPGKVSKDELLTFLKDNTPDIREVLYVPEPADALPDGWSLTFNSQASHYSVLNHRGQPIVDGVQSIAEAKERASAVFAVAFQVQSIEQQQVNPEQYWRQGARFQGQTLPPSVFETDRHYRELVLTLGESDALKDAKAERDIQVFLTNWVEGHAFADLSDQHKKDFTAAFGDLTDFAMRGRHSRNPEQWQPQHYLDRNALAHIRFDIRPDQHGNRVMHIAEIQSDWHQAGRRVGYQATPPANYHLGDPNRNFGACTRGAKAAREEIDRRWPGLERSLCRLASSTMPALEGAPPEAKGSLEALHTWATNAGRDTAELTAFMIDHTQWRRYGESSPGFSMGLKEVDRYIELTERAESQDAAAQDLSRSYNAKRVPDGPFKKTWHMVAFKRALAYAVNEGFEGISWDAGSAHASRYGLNTTIDRIEFSAKDNTVLAFKGEDVVASFNVNGTGGLENALGKRLAEELLSSPERSPHDRDIRVLSGISTEFGGRGLATFYDEILRRGVSDYVGQWGVKVGMDAVEADGRLVDAHHLLFNDLLRESVRDGQPLFSRSISSPVVSASDDPLSAQERSSAASDSLPVDHDSRMERAKAQGFSERIWWHGGFSDFEAFDPVRSPTGNFFFAESSRFAEDYASTRSFDEQGDYDIVVRPFMLKGTLFDPQDEGHLRALADALPEKVTTESFYGWGAFGGPKQHDKNDFLRLIQGWDTPYTPITDDIKRLLDEGERYIRIEGEMCDVISYDGDVVRYRGGFYGDHCREYERQIAHAQQTPHLAFKVPLIRLEYDRLLAELDSKPPRKATVYPDVSPGHDTWSYFESPMVVETLKRAGFSGALATERGQTTAAVFHPSHIRSPDACFHPDYEDSPNVYFSRKATEIAPAATLPERAPAPDGELSANDLSGAFEPEPMEPKAWAQFLSEMSAHVSSNWLRKPEITVVQNMTDPLIPEEVRGEFERQQAGGAAGVTEGFFIDNNQVFLVADNLKSVDRAMTVLYHETLGHNGLHGHFGPELDAVLIDVASRMPDEMAAKAASYGLDLKEPGDRMIAAEEILAEMAQERKASPLKDRAIDAARTSVRDSLLFFTPSRVFKALPSGFKDWATKITDVEIERRYLAPAAGFIERGQTGDLVRQRENIQRQFEDEVRSAQSAIPTMDR